MATMENRPMSKIAQILKEEGLAKKAADYGPFDPKDKVNVSLGGRRITILKDKAMTVAEAIELDELLNKLYELTGGDGTGWSESNKLDRFQEIDEELKELKAEKKKLESELKPVMSKAKSLGILDHYLGGGDNMIEVYFEGPDGTEYRILEGDVEEF